MDYLATARTRSQALGLLGLTGMASAVELKRAWKRRVVELHPDRTGCDGSRLMELNAAYAYLTGAPSEFGQQATSEAPKPSRPRRAVRSKQVVHFEADLIERARAMLEEAAAEMGGEVTLHVPASMHIDGAEKIFFAPSKLAEGRNLMALVLRGSENIQRAVIEIVSLSRKAPGQTCVELPQEMVEEFFPRRTSVKVQFSHAG